jgi:hypothetical protein
MLQDHVSRTKGVREPPYDIRSCGLAMRGPGLAETSPTLEPFDRRGLSGISRIQENDPCPGITESTQQRLTEVNLGSRAPVKPVDSAAQ